MYNKNANMYDISFYEASISFTLDIYYSEF